MTEKPPKNKTPIWVTLALAFGFTTGNVAGNLGSQTAEDLAPIYDGESSWALVVTGQKNAVLRVKTLSSFGFPTYEAKRPLSLPDAVQNEILSLSGNKPFFGAMITPQRAVFRSGDAFFTSPLSPLLARSFVEQNLPKWCAENSGLCEPPKEGKK